MSIPKKALNLPTLYKRCMHSPIGPLTMTASDKGLQAIDFVWSELDDEHEHLIEAEKQLASYFSGQRQVFDLPLDFARGTPFQQQVWMSLAAIPFGAYRSYKEQAAILGRSKGFRAVGAANGKNPLPIVLPCHRVIAAHGHLHGYSAGLAIKKSLLEIEGVLCRNYRIIRKVEISDPERGVPLHP